MELLERTIAEIGELDQSIMEQAKVRLDNLTKPVGSLGDLEKLAIKLAGIRGELYPDFNQKVHIVMAGDHGVAGEGVSAFPQEVTTQMVHNFINNGAAINVLAAEVGAELRVVDIGMIDTIDDQTLIQKKIKNGTDNMVYGPAMTEIEAVRALEVGIEVAHKAIDEGANLISTGEVGIGNTTPSSAILAVLSDLDLKEIVGIGTGLDSKGLNNKINTIEKAIKTNTPDPQNALDILAKVGGLEIAGMAGVMLGAASRNTPVILDGLISTAAALIASQLSPELRDYLIPSHKSSEPGHIKIYEKLGLEPFIDLKMRLGEGTGAVLAIPFVEASISILKNMATFEEAGVSQG